MTVFKAFWKVIKKYKGTIILYTVMLILFGGLNMTSNNISTTFVDSKPDILIVNNDEEVGLTKNLVDYLKNNGNVIDVDKDEDSINDSLFYREVNYVIYIPKNYREDILNGLDPEIEIKTTGDYEAGLAEVLLSRYLKVQKIYSDSIDDENELISLINENMNIKTNVELVSKVDTAKTSKIARYFNFASYSIMAVVIYIICLVLSSFHEKNVNKRNIVSSMNYKKQNRLILYASISYGVIIFILYVLLGVIILGTDILSLRGFIYILNTLLFTFCSLTIALFISIAINNKNAINGIVNVVALGSAFLCGAFVPAQWLPKSVLAFAHVLPSYWYINSNDLLTNLEVINITNLNRIFVNMAVVLGFSLLFIVLNNIVSKKKRSI
mgnify:FL=1